jgi:hypothetical protein
MRFLFRSKDEPATLNHVFSGDIPVSCQFVNGWFCKVCDCVTEHEKVDGAQVCCVCKTAKVPTVPLQVIEYKQFRNALTLYSEKIEFEAVKDELLDSGKCSIDWYVQARMQLHSDKILEEVIVNAKY